MNLDITWGSQWVATLENVPMRMRPDPSPRMSRTVRTRSSHPAQSADAYPSSLSPSRVRRTPPRPLSRSTIPQSFSRSEIILLTPDCEHPMASAAFVNPPSLAASTKALHFSTLTSDSIRPPHESIRF